MLQLVTLPALGSVSASAHVISNYNGPTDLESLKPIAHSLFGTLPLKLSKHLLVHGGVEIVRDGVVLHFTENAVQTPIVVRHIFSSKLALVLQSFDDNIPHTVAMFNFGDLFDTEIATRINLLAFSNKWTAMHRVWALAEGRDHVMCAYNDIRFVWAGHN